MRREPGVHLDLVVRSSDGDVVRTYESGPTDLATENWLKAFSRVMGFLGDNPLSIEMVNREGTTETYSMTDTGNLDLGIFNFATSPDSGEDSSQSGRFPGIGLGDGGGSAVTPARSNFALDNEVFYGTPDVGDSGDDEVVMTKSFANTTGATITIREAGYFIQWGVSNRDEHVLCFHDATADTPVTDGQTVTATYTWTFP